MSSSLIPDQQFPQDEGLHGSTPYNGRYIFMSDNDWMVPEAKLLGEWLTKTLEDLEAKKRKVVFKPSIQAFKDFIESDPEVYLGFHRIFEGLPSRPPGGPPEVRDYVTLLKLFDSFIDKAPAFSTNYLVLLPFTAVLLWPMSFSNGFTILVNRDVNRHIRSIFNEWSKFLQSRKSRYVLNDQDGWLSPAALKMMPDFEKTFICDPSKPHWGFDSWDDFFARRLRSDARPVAGTNDSSVITSACESKVLRISYNVDLCAEFWLKGGRYSLQHMLNNNPEAESFVGGTVYQAFLSPFYYHRFSSPVDGVIEKTEIVQGTYFAPIPDNKPPHDVELIEEQQSYLAHMATRALVFIRADDPKIGLLCFVAVGMTEVSSCEITARPGQSVSKGQDIGTFHFGGSTHCVVFGPGTKPKFTVTPGTFVPVNSQIAVVE